MSRILKRSSFGLVRTNPKLSTNIQIVADSKNRLFLETIDANSALSRSTYKAYPVNSSNSYCYDLARFYSQNGTPISPEIAYYVHEKDESLEPKDRYKNQYDFTYGAGFYVKNSRAYDEEYAIFAPVWLEKDNLPGRFVIFKMDGPVTVNANDPSFDGLDKDTDLTLDSLVKDRAYFNANFIKKSRIVASFDLSEKTELGRYIRNHVNDPGFPESPIYYSPQKNSQTYWQGISFDKGGFVKKSQDVYLEYVAVDKTIIEADDYMTLGFQRNSVVVANLLNIEFLFDDPTESRYEFSRYFGLYVNEAEIGEFCIDGDRLFDDRDRETTQVLRPSMNIIGYSSNTKDQIQTNELGIKVYPEIFTGPTGATYIQSGRLVTWEETQLNRFCYVKDALGRLYSIDNNRNWSVNYTSVDTGSIEVDLTGSPFLNVDPYNNSAGIYLPGPAVNGYPAWYLGGYGSTGATSAVYFEGSTAVVSTAPSWVLFWTGGFLAYGLTAGNPSMPWETPFSDGGGGTAIITANIDDITDRGYIRLKDRTVNWKTFSGFEEAYSKVDAKLTSQKGRPGFSFKVLSTPNSGDEIRIKHVDWASSGSTGIIDFYSVCGDDSLPAGTISALQWSTKGTPKDIASAISKAINNIEALIGETQIFRSISKDDEVVVFAINASENWNRIRWTLFSTATSFPFDPFNDFEEVVAISDYVPTPVSSSTPIAGKFYSDHFRGGCDNPLARCIIDRASSLEFVSNGEKIFVKTVQGYNEIAEIGMYFDEPVYNGQGDIVDFVGYSDNFVVVLKDKTQSFDLGQVRRIGLHRLATNKCGFLSILPIRDFDFDFWSSYYAKTADSDPAALYNWYTAGTGGSGQLPIFDYTALGPSSIIFVDGFVGPTSSFVVNDGFQGLVGIADEYTDIEDIPTNEYSRLKENSLSELALDSRVVPFINKWVYDNESMDVRENNYRLNVDQSFSYSGFSPSFDQLDRNSKFFTHEWYYLQRYPPYMTFDQKLSSFSYFDEEINFETIPLQSDPDFDTIVAGLTGASGASAGLLSVIDDYFTSYFTRETVDGVAVPRDFRYSIFAYGDRNKHPETLFRGVKVDIKERPEFSPINYNKDSLRFIASEKYNGYRFSAVLTDSGVGSQITVIKNDKWKAVTMVIQAELRNDLTEFYDSGVGATSYFVDRTILYALNHKIDFQGSTATYSDKKISGGIINWIDNGNEFVIVGGSSTDGTFCNFSDEITINENGVYNSILATDGTYSFEFGEIFDITSSSFKCKKIYSSTLDTIPIVPDGTKSLFPSIYYGMWSSVYWLRDQYVQSLRTDINYVGGGYNAFKILSDSISFGDIAHRVGGGDPKIKYVNVDKNGKVEYDTFCIELNRPEYLYKLSYAEPVKIANRPIDFQNSTETIGYELKPTKRTSVIEFTRVRGGFAPKFTDVFKFADTEELKAEGLDYLNIEFYLGDGYPFGLIKDLYFNKVNAENPNLILRSSSSDSDRSIFPDIDEIAIDHRDFFVLRSNWDPHFYRKYLKKNVSIPAIGTREPKEIKTFMGSKTIAIPDVVRIETFPEGIITLPELGSLSMIETVDPNIVLEQKDLSSNSKVDVHVFTGLILENWLISNRFGAQFEKYIDPAYSFGSRGLEDDIKLYIKENIYERYYVSDINFYEKPMTKGETYPLFNSSLDDFGKQRAGYSQSKNFSVRNFSSESLDFTMSYSIPTDRRISIALTIVLKKK